MTILPMGNNMATAYKLFRVSRKTPGNIYPLFVDAATPVPIGEWIDANEGPTDDNGKVKSRLGPLCFRPGWHLSDIPLALHIGEKGDDGNISFMSHNHVWCECEYSDEISYQEEADKNGTNGSRFNQNKAYIKHIPINGFYRYKTNPNMLGNWIIAGSIKVTRVLGDEEAAEIVKNNGYEPLPRKNGPINLSDFGL